MKLVRSPLYAALLWTGIALPAAGQVVINEYVSSNVDSLLDETGKTPDWIELWNSGSSVVNLAGWGLSDDPNDPFQWVFPDRFLQPNEYLIVFASGLDRRVQHNQLTTVITEGDRWAYLPGTAEPSSNWRSPSFNDSNWSVGPSGFGRGDGDDATVVQADTVYLRKSFLIPPGLADQVTMVYLHMDVDDGYVAYLNDVEIARQNLGRPGDHPPFDQRADKDSEARLYKGWRLTAIALDDFRNLMLPGKNVLALQVHNSAAQGDDLSAIPMLTIGRTRANPLDDVHPGLLFPEPALHSNFKLDSSGDTLLLTQANGSLADQIDTGKMYVDVARGRHPGGAGGQWYFEYPTPGAPNPASAWQEYSKPVEISPASGLLTSGDMVTLSHPDPGALIYYTLDASLPTTSSMLYTGPLTLTGPAHVLRARAFEANRWPSFPTTRSYFDQVYSALPIFSLVTDPPNLWDPVIGMYENWREDWERPMHIDMFEPDGSLGLSFDAGARIHGGLSRLWAQKSFRILARGGYGPTDLNYRMFQTAGLDSFKHFLLRNAGTDNLKSHLRDGFTSRLIDGVDLDHELYRPAVAVLNGDYWGLLNLRERVDKYYVQAHHGVDPDQLDLLENVGRGHLKVMDVQAIEGDVQHWDNMISFIARNPMSDPANYAHLQTLVDTDNYATYQILEIFVANTDWPHKNTKFWRERSPDGRWRWLLYDADNGLGYVQDAFHNTLLYAIGRDLGNGTLNSTFMFRELLTSDQFRIDFINRYADYLNTRFRSERTLKILDEMRQEMDPEMRRHMNRWGRSHQAWVKEVDKVDLFCQLRPEQAAKHILNVFQLAGTYTLDLDVFPAGAGRIKLTAIEVGESFSGTYFLGVPVQAEAIAAEGYQFDSWSDPNLPNSAQISFDPLTDYALSANFVQIGPAALIHELNVKSTSDFDPGDWIELHNNSDQLLDLSGWEIQDDANGYFIPSGTTLAGRDYLVICQDLAAFQLAFPAVNNAIGDLGFAFKGTGETLQLLDPAGILRDQLTYQNQPPWPIPPFGQGPTLELLRPALDNADGYQWRTSLAEHGTPGAANSAID
jgi:CotH kinase protein/Chitobiase/beta-hexosaminidase C-terminal domain/Lamin Tail Domain